MFKGSVWKVKPRSNSPLHPSLPFLFHWVKGSACVGPPQSSSLLNTRRRRKRSRKRPLFRPLADYLLTRPPAPPPPALHCTAMPASFVSVLPAAIEAKPALSRSRLTLHSRRSLSPHTHWTDYTVSLNVIQLNFEQSPLGLE